MSVYGLDNCLKVVGVLGQGVSEILLATNKVVRILILRKSFFKTAENLS